MLFNIIANTQAGDPQIPGPSAFFGFMGVTLALVLASNHFFHFFNSIIQIS